MIKRMPSLQNDFISGSLAIINCPAKEDGEDVSDPPPPP